ncbi:MAG: lysophospholipase [Undibacterium sp.]|nr:lysophospholipase [Undibacterium sp.]
MPSQRGGFDYRGYGRSAGSPSIENMKQDALQIYDHIRAKTPGKLIVHGQSLGSFMAAYVAQNRVTDGVVLESTASNPLDWAQANIPWYARPFVGIELSPDLKVIDNVAAARQHRAPALVMVGEQDRTTPPELGRKVFAAFPNAASQFLLVHDVGHNGVMKKDQAKTAYCAFLIGLDK